MSYDRAVNRSRRKDEGKSFSKLIFNDDEKYYERFNPRAWAQRHRDEIRGGLRVRMVIGADDELFKANTDFKELLDKLQISYSWEAVPGVAHCTKCLYDKVGLAGLKFIEESFVPRAEGK